MGTWPLGASTTVITWPKRPRLSALSSVACVVWSIWGAAIINEPLLCLGAHKMYCFTWEWCLHSFFFWDKGKDHAAPSESLLTIFETRGRTMQRSLSLLLTLQLQLKVWIFQPAGDDTILQVVSSTQWQKIWIRCTNCRLCVYPSSACSNASSKFPCSTDPAEPANQKWRRQPRVGFVFRFWEQTTISHNIENIQDQCRSPNL